MIAERSRGAGSIARARRLLGVVTPTGWLAIGLAATAWCVGWWFGWHEFMVIAAVCVTALVLSALFLVGGSRLAVELEVRPNRVVVGRPAAGSLQVTNLARRRLLASTIELSVGRGAAEFDLPSLASGETHEELFVLPTERRAVIPVGPATSVRGDPIGLLRRSVVWTEPVPLIVHPRTVALPNLGAGFFRDLEGQTTTDPSPADLAFHTMREYEPGDDRRFVHWLTTARVGRLMVRQFTDTRRAHLAVLLDGNRRAYAEDEEFEVAVSAAGSLGLRAFRDDQEVTMVAAGRRLSCVTPRAMLDGLSAVDLSNRTKSLTAQADQLIRIGDGISLAMVITGSVPTIADMRAVALHFPVDIRTILVRVDLAGRTGFQPVGTNLVVTVASLDELAHLVASVVRS